MRRIPRSRESRGLFRRDAARVARVVVRRPKTPRSPRSVKTLRTRLFAVAGNARVEAVPTRRFPRDRGVIDENTLRMMTHRSHGVEGHHSGHVDGGCEYDSARRFASGFPRREKRELA
eukprot:31315-Pelagococcus_subviridis.AAC.11